jgi:glycosyltransferase involved in cell wall biosynthesis
MARMRAAVSIVICTRNRADRLQPMLEALARIESQHTWQVLIVDNASTDHTAQVLAKADDLGGRLRTIRVERIGLGAARDAAWRATTGDIVAFTDDDCYVAPDFVDELVSAFERRADTDLIGGRILLFDPSDARVTIDERGSPETIEPFAFIPSGALHGANLSFRRTVLERIGGFDPELGAGSHWRSGEDTDAVAKAVGTGTRAGYDPGPTIHHHHGRKEADVPRLNAGYDRGSGAYYAKFVLRRDSRSTYLRGWFYLCLSRSRSEYGAIRGELVGAALYFAHRRRYELILLGALIAVVLYPALYLRLALRKIIVRRSKTSFRLASR